MRRNTSGKIYTPSGTTLRVSYGFPTVTLSGLTLRMSDRRYETPELARNACRRFAPCGGWASGRMLKIGA